MPRTKSLAWSELKIGLMAVIAIALTAVLVVAVGGASGFFWERYSLKTTFDNVLGLKSGAIVRVAGVEVGKVTDVHLRGSTVVVDLSVKKENQSRITTDSRASIGSMSLLGEPLIDVTPASTGTPLKDGDTITSAKRAAQLSDVTGTMQEGLTEATALLKDIRAGRGTIGQMFTNDEVFRELDAFIASANQVTASINKSRGTLGKLTNDPKVYDDVDASVSELHAMVARINAGEGSLGQLLKDDKLAKSLNATSANFEQVSGRLTRGDNTAGKLLTEKELYDRLNSTVNRLDELTRNLNQGQGTAGQLLHDQKLYDNMNETANQLKGLIADIRKDPKKYLNVRVSIF
ncbi:MAG TPA: MlaD family protein [Vicinamibacterales bacterium]|jgi:phospholipid/cholesterol/gamma-HCH transport system substrate-binding protein|nr:MlaD family protein [Vicinamibacterales bacterium]